MDHQEGLVDLVDLEGQVEQEAICLETKDLGVLEEAEWMVTRLKRMDRALKAIDDSQT